MRRQKGFTLLELAVAIGIIAILSAGIGLLARSYYKESQTTEIMQYIADWKMSVRRYYTIYNSYPNSTTQNNFNTRFLSRTTIDSNINFISYSQSVSCAGANRPVITIDIGDNDMVSRVSNELNKRGIPICNTNGTRLTIAVD
jgi:prepilin-type N-terminal cleavage/methylation domain-containing protein